MPGQPAPPLITQAFAVDAAAPYITTIPETTVDDERASWELGFPPKTMTEIFAGGTPPYGQDMNGVLNALSAHVVATEAGQPAYYSGALATAMGGYAAGAVIGMADGTGEWLNTVSGNATNPDDNATAANWLPLYARGFATPVTPGFGVYTLLPSEYRRSMILLSGTLTGNLQVIVPSGVNIGQRRWLVVNSMTGGFVVTVKTAAGSGVAVPAGGFAAPTEVYGDGVNVYPAVAPVGLPIDQNPTPNTIALRTNAGYLFATYFNQNSPLENFSVNGVFAESGDGYFRKISRVDFSAQINIQWLAGVIANAQVPLSAVIQYAANILSNAALTGAPTTPTAGVGTNSAQVASTQYAYGQSFGGATYTDQTANRGLGVAYTNSTGKPLMVTFQGGVSANGAVQATVGGVACGGFSLGAATFNQCMSFIVPPGGVYQINRTAGSATAYTWTELN